MTLKATLDPYVRRLSGGRLYLSYQLQEAEHVGSVSLYASIREMLEARGWEDPPRMILKLEARKEHPEGNLYHDISYRKIPGELPACVSGTGLDSYRAEQLQYHLHGFVVGERIELFCHLELRPDMERIGTESRTDAIGRLKGHLGPTWEHENRPKESWTYLFEAPDELVELV